MTSNQDIPPGRSDHISVTEISDAKILSSEIANTVNVRLASKPKSKRDLADRAVPIIVHNDQHRY